MKYVTGRLYLTYIEQKKIVYLDKSLDSVEIPFVFHLLRLIGCKIMMVMAALLFFIEAVCSSLIPSFFGSAEW